MGQIKNSLIVTVKNDADALRLLLKSIASQEVTPDEVVLTIAPSTQTEDTTLTVATSWKPRCIAVQIIELEPEATRSTGRNQGVAAAQGSLLLFTDAGCTLSPTWVKNILHAFSLPETKLVSGYSQSTNDTPQEEVQGAFTLVPRNAIERFPLPATRNMAVRREVFEKVGLFRDELNYAEDFEWARRARSLGMRSTFVPDATVRWRPRKSWSAFGQMIFSLTAGDMQARTWRLGHFTMWMRYIFIIFTIWTFSKITSSLTLGLLSGAVAWTLYIGLKMSRFRFSNSAAYLWVPLAQALADIAVLTGTLCGLYRLWKKQKASWKAGHA